MSKTLGKLGTNFRLEIVSGMEAGRKSQQTQKVADGFISIYNFSFLQRYATYLCMYKVLNF